MPSAAVSKRSRRAAFDDDDYGNCAAVDSASSSLRNDGQRKKVRLSAAGPTKFCARSRRQETPGSSGGEEDEAMQDAEEELDAPPATQYEIMRDAGFKHLEHTEEDDQRATQRLRNRTEVLGENRVAQNAVIESITCFNFMCHTRLHCDLGPLLNFIVGENGSGKSAILTAITLCLGGKASSTNRGGSLRSFVKEGQDHAKLVVKIKNQGEDAYKPELFGDSIIVERHFSKTGSSGFKLKSTANKIISTKKGDVDDVVEYYCLQVDNPLNVLSQDNARQFLNSASASTKYKYFVQGTQLEQLDHDLQLISEYIDALEVRLDHYDEELAAYKDKYEKAKKLRDTASKHDEMRRQTIVLRNQLTWAQVVEQETILQEREIKIVECGQAITQLQQEIEQKSEILARHDEQIEAAQGALIEVQQEEERLEEQVTEANDKFRGAKTTLEQMRSQERDLREQLKQADKNVKYYEDQIRGEKQKLEEANGGALGEKQKKKAEAEKLVDNAKANIAQHAEDRSQLDEEFRQAEMEAAEASKLVEQKRQEVSSMEARIRNFSQSRADPLAGYDPQMRQLLKVIENDREFHQKPIGPLGTLVQLTKPAWSAILEAALGSTLNSFLVADKHDQSLLFKHMERLKIRGCGGLISRPRPSLTNLREPDEGFETILRVLKFDDIRVRDQLIIANHIEQTILIQDRREATHVVIGERPPRNVSSCLTFHGHALKRNHGLRISAGRTLQSNPITPNKDPRPRMKSDSESQVSLQKENLAVLRSELNELETSKRHLTQVVQKCSQAVTRHKRQAGALESELRQAQAVVRQLDEDLDEFEGSDVRLQGLQTQLNEAKENMEIYGQQFGEMQGPKSEQSKILEELKEKVKEAKAHKEKFSERLQKAELKVSRLTGSRRIALVEKNNAHQKYEEAKIAKQDAEGRKERQARHVEDMTRDASEICQRIFIPDGETYHSIERKFESIKSQIKKFETQTGRTHEQINNEFAAAREAYSQARKNDDHCKGLSRILKAALMARLKKYRNLQRHASAQSRAHFKFLLSERAFRGELKLDHKRKRLELQVEPDETRKNVSGRNTKTLSGGEKSFSSICLLLSIWDAMGSPLRCLDEFDVFMDNVNRAISTNMLIQAARRSVGKQFILITPNAIEGRAKVDKDVKIIRLTDPRQKRIDQYGEEEED